tara:strand:- start:274 stop:390 length:117 start_codon:yes stop_codon:yes gene_type:complete
MSWWTQKLIEGVCLFIAFSLIRGVLKGKGSKKRKKGNK